MLFLHTYTLPSCFPLYWSLTTTSSTRDRCKQKYRPNSILLKATHALMYNIHSVLTFSLSLHCTDVTSTTGGHLRTCMNDTLTGIPVSH